MQLLQTAKKLIILLDFVAGVGKMSFYKDMKSLGPCSTKGVNLLYVVNKKLDIICVLYNKNF